jgi:histidine triad (HIT) family protein
LKERRGFEVFSEGPFLDGNWIAKEGVVEDCIFCKIIKGQIPCFKVYEDDKVLSFEDINPISIGHTLVIPKEHVQDLWEISEGDLTAVCLAAKKIIHAIKEVLNPAGVACLQLNGRGVNQVVMHYHLHLIPRSSGGPELPMTNWEIKPGDMEVIGRTAKSIASAVK